MIYVKHRGQSYRQSAISTVASAVMLLPTAHELRPPPTRQYFKFLPVLK